MDVLDRSDRPLLESEWEALEDPPEGRYEILHGKLVVSPSFNRDHSRSSEDLSDLLREAIAAAGVDLEVTMDVEYRVVAGGRVTEAPRGDIVVGRMSSVDRFHKELPLLIVEVWSAQTRPGVIANRRKYWTFRGLRHYWEIRLTEPATDLTLSIYDLQAQLLPTQHGTGSEEVSVNEPFEVTVVPNDIVGWTARRFATLHATNDQLNETNDQLNETNERLTAELRRLGGDPDSV